MKALFDNDKIQRGASFSPCRTWRYLLTRRWNPDRPTWLFVGLNPSKADETRDDHTITKEMGFVRQWGGGGLVMANLFALRSTDPQALYTHPDPVGKLNDTWLDHLIGRDDIGGLVCCWGAHGSFMERGVITAVMLSRFNKPLHVFGFTKNGQPLHPLRLAYSTPLQVWNPLEVTA